MQIITQIITGAIIEIKVHTEVGVMVIIFQKDQYQAKLKIASCPNNIRRIRCFKCNEEGHKIANCPTEPRLQDRTVVLLIADQILN